MSILAAPRPLPIRQVAVETAKGFLVLLTEAAESLDVFGAAPSTSAILRAQVFRFWDV